jgi:hypothetical protein
MAVTANQNQKESEAGELAMPTQINHDGASR